MKGDKIVTRVSLLSVLFMMGLLLASIGNGLGAGQVFRGTPKEVGLVMINGQLTIYEDGVAIV